MTCRSHLRAYPALNGHPSHDDSPSLHRCYPSGRNIHSRGNLFPRLERMCAPVSRERWDERLGT
jgi:hypothetical protein